MKINHHLQKIETFFLDTLLPKHCLSCNQEGAFLCKNCLKKIKLNSFQVCPICQKFLTEFGEICRYCKPLKPPIDSLTLATDYKDPLVSKAVHLFKYKFVDELADSLAEILVKIYQKNKLPIPDFIIPVPLHPLRLRWRGFNQAELLANNLGSNLLSNFPVEVNNQILSRVKFTSTQAKLKNAENRQENLKKAFQVDLKFLEKIKNRRILLIDDISTTGSTLMECGKELRKLKPKSIHCLVIARQK